MTLTLAGTIDKIAMIEAGADELPDNKMLEAIKIAHKEIKKICEFITNIKNEIGKPKFEYKSFSVNEEIYKIISEEFKDRMYKGVQTPDKIERDINMDK